MATLTEQEIRDACGVKRVCYMANINKSYGGNGKKYLVVSTLVAPMFGPFPTIICYIVFNKGRLRRMWLQ